MWSKNYTTWEVKTILHGKLKLYYMGSKHYTTWGVKNYATWGVKTTLHGE